jgi:hypothetical protein
MADITMCEGYNCALKTQCRRYMATPSRRQSYFTKDPRNPDRSCDHFWNLIDNYTPKKKDK